MALNKKYNPDKSLDAAMGNLFEEPVKTENPKSYAEPEVRYIKPEKVNTSKKADLHIMIDEDILTEARIYLLKNKSKKISEYIEGLIKKDLGL